MQSRKLLLLLLLTPLPTKWHCPMPPVTWNVIRTVVLLTEFYCTLSCFYYGIKFHRKQNSIVQNVRKISSFCANLWVTILFQFWIRYSVFLTEYSDCNYGFVYKMFCLHASITALILSKQLMDTLDIDLCRLVLYHMSETKTYSMFKVL